MAKWLVLTSTRDGKPISILHDAVVSLSAECDGYNGPYTEIGLVGSKPTYVTETVNFIKELMETVDG